MTSKKENTAQVEVISQVADPESASVMNVMKIAASATLARIQASKSLIVTALLTDDVHMKELNLAFMNEDDVTDVLSFNEDSGWKEGTPPDNGGDAFAARGDSHRLGDIALCLPQVKRQAREAGKTTEDEAAMLTVHGVLHLLGYDHEEGEQAKRMFGLTDDILKGLPTVEKAM